MALRRQAGLSRRAPPSLARAKRQLEMTGSAMHFYVIKSEELVAINYLPDDYSKPESCEWIDRGTDRKLSPSRRDQFLRTFQRRNPSRGILRLRRSAGLRVIFASEEARTEFTRLFLAAKRAAAADAQRFVAAVFETPERAQSAMEELEASGVAPEAISLMLQGSRFLDSASADTDGHSPLAVFAGVSAGGVAGMLAGMAVFSIPGFGPIAVLGLAAASPIASVATACGVIGATGTAIATMLSDLDVDEVAANHLEHQLRHGSVFVAVDREIAAVDRDELIRRLETFGGRIV